MVKGGFRRRGGDSTDSVHYHYTNDDIARLCQTKPASVFCDAQHLKFIGHVSRMDNDVPQKQWLFGQKTKHQKDQWLLLGKDWNLSPGQIRKTISNKESINELLKATT